MANEIGEFWPMLNADDIQIQDDGFQKWGEFTKTHPQYFDSIKEKFSKKFYTFYQKINFHDFHVIDINFYSKPSRKSEIQLNLFDYHEDYGKNLYFGLIYRDVREYCINVKSTEFAITWGHDIFEVVENGMLKHRILCCDGASIEIVFKTISLIKQKSSNAIN